MLMPWNRNQPMQRDVIGWETHPIIRWRFKEVSRIYVSRIVWENRPTDKRQEKTAQCHDRVTKKPWWDNLRSADKMRKWEETKFPVLLAKILEPADKAEEKRWTVTFKRRQYCENMEDRQSRWGRVHCKQKWVPKLYEGSWGGFFELATLSYQTTSCYPSKIWVIPNDSDNYVCNLKEMRIPPIFQGKRSSPCDDSI